MNHLRGVEGSGANGHEKDLVLADDAFLDELARGVDPSDGADELAGLLLGLKAEVEAPMPPAPLVTDAPTTAMPPLRNVVPAFEQEFEEKEYEDAEVIDLSARRPKRSFRQAFMHGIIGAAAATLAIAGSGIAIYNAGPGSPLWGAHVALFSDHAAVVELASTLEQADDSRSRGDVEGALELLDQARSMAADIQSKRGSDSGPVTTVTVTQGPVATSTSEKPKTEEPEEPSSPAAPPPPVTVTATVTVVQQPAPAQQPTSQAPTPGGPDNPNPQDPVQPPAEPSPPGDNNGGN